jgi:hypothetical protein
MLERRVCGGTRRSNQDHSGGLHLSQGEPVCSTKPGIREQPPQDMYRIYNYLDDRLDSDPSLFRNLIRPSQGVLPGPEMSSNAGN